tara:strand:- start:124 stop:327 length:204 start_codon:yes stop_codon:yes gene_type:complete
MYSDKYKIRLPGEVLADLEEAAAAAPQACSVAPPKKRRHLKPFTGKKSEKPSPEIEEILAAVQSPAN